MKIPPAFHTWEEITSMCWKSRSSRKPIMFLYYPSLFFHLKQKKQLFKFSTVQSGPTTKTSNWSLEFPSLLPLSWNRHNGTSSTYMSTLLWDSLARSSTTFDIISLPTYQWVYSSDWIYYKRNHFQQASPANHSSYIGQTHTAYINTLYIRDQTWHYFWRMQVKADVTSSYPL